MNRVRELTGVSCAYKQGIFGDGIGVAVLDSGVNERHPDLRGRLVYSYNYLTAFKLLMEHIENKEINTAFMPINGVGKTNDERQKKDIIDSLCQLSKNPTLLIDSDISADQFAELAEETSLRITQLKDINPNFITIEDLFDNMDKQFFRIDKRHKDALASSLFKNNIIEYYEKKSCKH